MHLSSRSWQGFCLSAREQIQEYAIEIEMDVFGLATCCLKVCSCLSMAIFMTSMSHCRTSSSICVICFSSWSPRLVLEGL
uniref:Uncharacterized protein n=1 Tax=Triticum urartu TaxID=4572 RepID=A0A8R7U536_TRIUA